jgi:hypothetical protein
LREAESKFANFPEKSEFLFLKLSGNIYVLHITSFIANATTPISTFPSTIQQNKTANWRQKMCITAVATAAATYMCFCKLLKALSPCFFHFSMLIIYVYFD